MEHIYSVTVYIYVCAYIYNPIKKLGNKHIFIDISRNTESFLIKIGILIPNKRCVLGLSNENQYLGYIMQIQTTDNGQVLKTFFSV